MNRDSDLIPDEAGLRVLPGEPEGASVEGGRAGDAEENRGALSPDYA